MQSYKTKATIEQAKQLAGFVLLFGGDVMNKLSRLEEIDVNQLLSEFENQMGVNHVRP